MPRLRRPRRRRRRSPGRWDSSVGAAEGTHGQGPLHSSGSSSSMRRPVAGSESRARSAGLAAATAPSSAAAASRPASFRSPTAFSRLSNDGIEAPLRASVSKPGRAIRGLFDGCRRGFPSGDRRFLRQIFWRGDLRTLATIGRRPCGRWRARFSQGAPIAGLRLDHPCRQVSGSATADFFPASPQENDDGRRRARFN